MLRDSTESGQDGTGSEQTKPDRTKLSDLEQGGMSKLNVDQKTIMALFQDKHSDFLIPDYQRPYAWAENECRTLWDDVFNFAIPDSGATEFDKNSEYFFGPIVVFKNGSKMEVIDGQQRLTTLMLLLRAFYERFSSMKDKASLSTKQNIEKCIWKTDEFGEPDKNELKISSEVATDDDKEEFLEILRTGELKEGQKSRYAANYNFFRKCIEAFLHDYPTYFPYLPTRIMQNCILLPIEAESQDTALRIFSTLNDRGKPLSDADIFKAQFYKYYSAKGLKDEFIKKWRELEEICAKNFNTGGGTPLDEIFTRYMYYVRALAGNKLSTTEGLRKFYEKDNYALLKKQETLEHLLLLAHFWDDVGRQNAERFSEPVLRRLFVLRYAPNGMWTYLVSVYFMHRHDEKGLLDDRDFYAFLSRIMAFIWTYAFTDPGVNVLRTPVYPEMVNIVTDKPVTFENFKFDVQRVKSLFANYIFTNFRLITRSMLTWWALEHKEQVLPQLERAFEIEHIYARNRQDKEKSLTDLHSLEMLGNKSLLEKNINIRASDYRFADKKKYYLGYALSSGRKLEGTMISELRELAQHEDDFTEKDIKVRTDAILNAWVQFLYSNELIRLPSASEGQGPQHEAQ